jgi:hypothetical protein
VFSALAIFRYTLSVNVLLALYKPVPEVPFHFKMELVLFYHIFALSFFINNATVNSINTTLCCSRGNMISDVLFFIGHSGRLELYPDKLMKTMYINIVRLKKIFNIIKISNINNHFLG